MRYSLNTNAFTHTHSISEIIAIAKDAGLEGIEWGLPSLEKSGADIIEMRKQTEDAGLEVVAYINGGKLWKHDDMQAWADVVASVEGSILRVAHPWIAYNYEEASHLKESWHDIFALARDGMPKLVELSEASGIRFVCETHGGALTSSALSAIKLFEGFSAKNVGIIYDPANTILEGSIRPRSEVEVLGDYLAYVHAKNAIYYFDGTWLEKPIRRMHWKYAITSPDSGILDYLELFFALKKSGYNGWISSEEYFRDSPDPGLALRTSIAFMKECETQAFSEPQEPFIRFND